MNRIIFHIVAALRGPIKEGDYIVKDAKVNVSYPPRIIIGGLPGPIDLPRSTSTLFVVSWLDKNDKDTKKLRSKTFMRFSPTYKALDYINEILMAFKLVRVGDVDGSALKAIGIDDTLIRICRINDEPNCELNIGMRLTKRDFDWIPDDDLDDPHETTELALPHIGKNTFPVARRYVRCFELLDHGYYTESFIIAFSILDDLTQRMLNDLFISQGLNNKADRDQLVRGIKESRLKIFLGPMLKLIKGVDLFMLWPEAGLALDWLNRKRNNIAHDGDNADHFTAAVGLYACLKILVVLHQNKILEAEFPVEMYRHAKLTASWTEQKPSWVPEGSAAESFDFN